MQHMHQEKQSLWVPDNGMKNRHQCGSATTVTTGEGVCVADAEKRDKRTGKGSTTTAAVVKCSSRKGRVKQKLEPASGLLTRVGVVFN